MTPFFLTLPLLFMAIAPPPRGTTTRIKELTSVEGVRDNQLIGYGVIVGLAGTGDRLQTVFSAQSLSNLLQRMGSRCREHRCAWPIRPRSWLRPRFLRSRNRGRALT